ncbi:MAG: hypothetical protein ABEH59_13560, partial [Halobacteriales archaeon]
MKLLRTSLYLGIVAMLIMGMVVPTAALASQSESPSNSDSFDGPESAALAVSNHSNTSNGTNRSVSVGVGQQLSTIISTTSDDTQTSFANFAFELDVETGNDSENAEAIADRADELSDRAQDIREDFRNATTAHEAGNISKGQYAQRLAALNGRAQNVLISLQSLQQRADNVSALELRAAGVNQSRLAEAIESLDNATGTGPSALLQRFTGASNASIELETEGGLSIEAESDDGERSREVRRTRDPNTNITISGAQALATAREALSKQVATWKLLKSSVHSVEGYYKFEFAFQTANETGEAEVRVDGSSGQVFRLEEEIEPQEDNETEPLETEEEREDELNETETEEPENETPANESVGDRNETGDQIEDGNESIDRLALVLVNGTPKPGGEITVQVLADGTGVGNVTVRLNGEPVGQTDTEGLLSLTLPETEAKLTASAGGEDGELEFEFEEEQEDIYRNLNVTVEIENRSATVTVSYNGSPVSSAEVYANDELVGKTPDDGTVSLSIANDTEELTIEVVKGEFEAEMEFELTDGEVNQTQDPHEGDGDKVEDEEEDEQEDGEEPDTPEGDDEEDQNDRDTPEDAGEETETP